VDTTIDFSHVIVTRFNLVGIGGVKTEKDWKEWNDQRFKLFNQYCLPSVLNQTAKFSWFLYFDIQTPEVHLSEIEELKKIPFIRVFILNGKQEFFDHYSSHIRESIPNSSKWVITTRIDNDDCIHREAVAKIQSKFKARENYSINLSSGYTLNLKENVLSHYFYLKSPFQSIVENIDSGELKGVYQKRHGQWEPGKAAPIQRELRSLRTGNRDYAYVLDEPLWVQLIHDKNISNDAVRGFPVFRKVDLSPFSIAHSNSRESLLKLPNYYSFLWWKRYFKALIIKFLYSIYRE
jgi:hypothetical protein